MSLSKCIGCAHYQRTPIAVNDIGGGAYETACGLGKEDEFFTEEGCEEYVPKECRVCANNGNEYCFVCDEGDRFKPITNADRIRSMSDKELAILFTTLISEIENGIMEKLKRAGVDADLIEFPIASVQSQLEYLQAEVDE